MGFGWEASVDDRVRDLCRLAELFHVDLQPSVDLGEVVCEEWLALIVGLHLTDILDVSKKFRVAEIRIRVKRAIRKLSFVLGVQCSSRSGSVRGCRDWVGVDASLNWAVLSSESKTSSWCGSTDQSENASSSESMTPSWCGVV